jgi:ABC-2 type transport system permease protein
MFSRILRHEWRTLTADRSLLLLAVVVALAIVYGTVNGARWVAFQQSAIAKADAEERERHATHEAEIVRINRAQAKVSDFSDPRSPGSAGRSLASRYAALPPTPLAALSIGQSDLLPYYFKMTTDSRETVTAGAELENPHRLLSGRFDLAFVLVYLYPLLVLALSYNVLSGEKEQGTLALLLSQPIALRTLVLAKVALRLLLFVGVIGVMALAAVAAVGIDVTDMANLSRFGLWLIVIAAYGAFWFALAVAVMAWGRPSATNAMALAGLWLVLVVVLPSVINLLATTLYRVPSRVAMIQAMRLASDEAAAEGSALLAKYYEDHPELTGGGAQAASEAAMLRVATNARIEQQVSPVLQQFEQQLQGQQRVVDRLRFLSPALLAQDALNEISGTGVIRHRQFLAQVTSYHQAWRAYFVPLIFQKMRLASYADVPRFTFREEPPSAAAVRVLLGVSGMLVPASLIGAWGLRALRRYPVAA